MTAASSEPPANTRPEPPSNTRAEPPPAASSEPPSNTRPEPPSNTRPEPPSAASPEPPSNTRPEPPSNTRAEPPLAASPEPPPAASPEPRTSACPELAELEAMPRAPAVLAHVAGCASCELVVALFERAARGGAAVDLADCTQFDALLAARADGTLAHAGHNLLARHLAGCADCRAVAETLSPTADAAGDHATLPSVDPASYALGLEVARGGMGRILAARDLRVGRPVAVKELLGRSPQLAARFEREARVTARLQHPGIVPIYEIGTWPDGTPFYTMRMVDGRTLRDAIAAAPTLAARLALLPALISAASAVAFAHAQRIIHRDLTPANILVGAYGETVVIDWGLAKDLADDSAHTDDGDPYRSPSTAAGASLTGAGAVIGTAPYMPPEQAHAQPVDERADVYALGAILYQLLAGVAPYAAPTTAALLRAVKAGPPRPIDALVRGAPRDLVSIADKAMARDPDQRYPSARELADELERFRTGRMVEAHEYSPRDRARRFVARHRGAVTATALAGLVLAAIATVAVTRVLRSRADARATAQQLLFEKARVEMLDGNTLGALAYLHAASTSGVATPALAFLVDAAIRSAPASSVLDCGGYAFSVAFSPDGTLLAAACTHHARIWRVADRAPLATLVPPAPSRDGISGIRFAPAGDAVVTWGTGGIARLWSTRAAAPLATFVHGAEISRVSFSPDGARLLTTGFDGHARLWDTRTGAELRDIVAATGLLRHVYGTLSPDGATILTSTIEGRGRGWDAATGAELGGFAHGAATLGGDVSPDGTYASSCGVDRLTRIWDARTGALVQTLGGHTDVIWRCIFDAASTHVLTTGHDGRANVWDIATGALVAGVVHRDVLASAELSPDGRRFVTIGVGGSVKVWDARSGALLASVDARRGKNATFTPDSRGLVVQRGDGRLELWDDLSIQDAAFAPGGGTLVGTAHDGTRALVEARDGWLALWDTRRARAIALPDVHAPFALGDRVLAATAARETRVIDVDTGRTRATLPMVARTLVISPRGDHVGVTPVHGPPVIWHVDPQRPVATRIATLIGMTELLAVTTDRAAILPQALGGRVAPLPPTPTVVALARASTAFAVWRFRRDPPPSDDRPAIRVLAAPADAVFASFASDGERVVLLEAPGSADQAVSVWDTATGALVLRDRALTARVDPGGRWLLTTDADRVVRIRDVRDGREHGAFQAEELDDAQLDARGGLVAALAEHGQVALVLDARDGRVLARWPIAHAPPSWSQTGFRAPRGTAAWSADGTTIVTTTGSVAIWHAAGHREPLASVMRRVPWRIVGGRAVALHDRVLRARVVRHGEPVAGATVAIEIRASRDVGQAELSWDAVHTRFVTRTVRTDDEGHFALAGVAPGAYRVTVTHGGATQTFDAFAAADLDDATEPVLELTELP